MTWHLVAVILTASIATALLAIAGLGLVVGLASSPPPLAASEAVFLFDEERLVDASAAAGSLLDQIRPGGSDWMRLMAYLEPRFPGVEMELAALATRRRIRREATSGAPLALEAEWRGGVARVTLFDPQAEAPGSLDRLSMRAQEEELAILRASVQDAPVLVWRQEGDGVISWANAAYLAHCGAAAQEAVWPLPRLLDLPPLPAGPPAAPAQAAPAAPQRPAPQRISVPGAGGRPLRWYDCHRMPQMGSELVFAVPATALVQAETSLREFVQTLGKTFAQLPIGLAIFDRTRKLQLFNPALVDLTLIGAEVLSARPSLFAFLDRLRENRIAPERKDYATWRQQMVALEKAAASGQYQETWNLATGQTYRVTGRPHPEGAVALLIEDISAEISLTRRFRAEMELGQQVLDSLPQAIAVFSSAGHLLLSNAAYARLWDMGEGATTLCQPGIGEAMRRWQAASAPSAAVWARVQGFVFTLGERAEWEGEIRHRDGRRLAVRLSAAADGATVVSFDPLPAAAAAAAQAASA